MIASQRAAEAALFYGGAGIFQRSAKPENRAAFYGRLKPPSSTVARAFFRGLRSPRTGPHSTGGSSRPLLRWRGHFSEGFEPRKQGPILRASEAALFCCFSVIFSA